MNTADDVGEMLGVMPLSRDDAQWVRQPSIRKRRVLLITTRSLFGSGIRTLLAEQGEHVTVEMVPTVRHAIQRPPAVFPDVVACFKERLTPEERTLLRGLGAHYGAKIICGTLDADRLTIYDEKQIEHATADDLIAAVLNTNGHQRASSIGNQ